MPISRTVKWRTVPRQPTTLEKAAIVYARLDRAFHLLKEPTSLQRRCCVRAYHAFMELALQKELQLRETK